MLVFVFERIEFIISNFLKVKKCKIKGSDPLKKEEVTLIKNDQGIAWAGMYWQYFEDLDKITGAETPLKLSKKVFVVSRDQNGELLTEVKSK
jgi:hypothetical protein